MSRQWRTPCRVPHRGTASAPQAPSGHRLREFDLASRCGSLGCPTAVGTSVGMLVANVVVRDPLALPGSPSASVSCS